MLPPPYAFIKMPPSRICIGVLISSALLTASGQGATARTVQMKPSCPRCSVVIEKELRLTDPTSDIDGASSRISFIDRDSRGRYWIADAGSPAALMVFDNRGKYLGKVGNIGSGPGEFRRIFAVVAGIGDTIHVFDRSLKRHSLVSPSTLKIVRELSWPSSNLHVVQRSDGGFVTSGDIGAGAAAGHPFEHVGADGGILKQFGGRNKTHLRWMNPWMTRHLAPDGSGGFFAVGRRDYTIERWSADGRHLGSWRPEPSWFPPSEPTMKPRPGIAEGLLPEVWSIWRASNGLLYVLWHTRQPDWKKSLITVKGEGQPVSDYSDANLYFDSVIDVYETESMTLLTSRRFDQYFWGRAGPDRLHTKGSEPHDFIDIWRVRVARP